MAPKPSRRAASGPARREGSAGRARQWGAPVGPPERWSAFNGVLGAKRASTGATTPCGGRPDRGSPRKGRERCGEGVGAVEARERAHLIRDWRRARAEPRLGRARRRGRGRAAPPAPTGDSVRTQARAGPPEADCAARHGVRCGRAPAAPRRSGTKPTPAPWGLGRPDRGVAKSRGSAPEAEQGPAPRGRAPPSPSPGDERPACEGPAVVGGRPLGGTRACLRPPRRAPGARPGGRPRRSSTPASVHAARGATLPPPRRGDR
jgi:hypothetical protein